MTGLVWSRDSATPTFPCSQSLTMYDTAHHALALSLSLPPSSLTTMPSGHDLHKGRVLESLSQAAGLARSVCGAAACERVPGKPTCGEEVPSQEESVEQQAFQLLSIALMRLACQHKRLGVCTALIGLGFPHVHLALGCRVWVYERLLLLL